MSAYPVTTIGAVPCAECAKSGFGCGAQGCSRRETIRGLDNLLILAPPLWPAWIGAKLAGAVVEKLTGENPNAKPSPINDLAKMIGIDPVVLALKIMGHEGWGQFYDPIKYAALAVGAGSAAYLAVKWQKGKGASKALARRKGTR